MIGHKSQFKIDALLKAPPRTVSIKPRSLLLGPFSIGSGPPSRGEAR